MQATSGEPWESQRAQILIRGSLVPLLCESVMGIPTKNLQEISTREKVQKEPEATLLGILGGSLRNLNARKYFLKIQDLGLL